MSIDPRFVERQIPGTPNGCDLARRFCRKSKACLVVVAVDAD
jgi:hypothetical protein